ncbi:hypothetical protein BG004_002023 [Podila humilis]|nr:hypothetical protein BG004_002023 [Podila humilis]
MSIFNSPTAKRHNSGSGGNASQQRLQASQPPASSLVPCPICDKKIPGWFVNNHLDNECPGMEGVAATVEQNINKRKIDDGSYLADADEEDEHTSSRSSTMGSSSQDQQLVALSRKEKVNAAVIKAMPLAERARPTNLDDYIGQRELIGPGGILRTFVQQDNVPSIILWGPCGVGKTTLARIIAHSTKAAFKEMSATTSGVADVKKAADDAKNLHRFNKAQQDIFLPFVEKGTITLIGATTENPSFRVNSALLSRCRVLTLSKLKEGMDRMIKRAGRIKWRDVLDTARESMNAIEQRQLATTLASSESSIDTWADETLESGAIQWLIDLSDGDGRSAINTVEMAIQSLATQIVPSGGVQTMDSIKAEESSIVEKLLSAKITAEAVKSAFQKTHLQYDRQGDQHYDLISALHKSIRGRTEFRHGFVLPAHKQIPSLDDSDVDASLYWLGRMLVAGEEPLYIARRMIRLASEDIGLADSSALPLAIAAYQACQTIGMPECDVNLAHCVAYMAKAKKSVDVYHAYNLVKQTVSEEYAYPVPIHLRNAPTALMKDLGFGAEYKYPPSYPEGFATGQEYVPRGLKRRKFIGEFPVMTEEEARNN